MRDAHANIKVNDNHFDLIVNHLADTLKELGVNSDLILEVAEVAESIRDEVLGR
jgi:truncated hemoglobin YjbI